MRINAQPVRTNIRRSQKELIRHLVRRLYPTVPPVPRTPTRHITRIEADPDHHHDLQTKLTESVMCVWQTRPLCERLSKKE